MRVLVSLNLTTKRSAVPCCGLWSKDYEVRGRRYVAEEGIVRDRKVVVEFSDFDTAIACYHSPDYQAAKAIRMANA